MPLVLGRLADADICFCHLPWYIVVGDAYVWAGRADADTPRVVCLY